MTCQQFLKTPHPRQWELLRQRAVLVAERHEAFFSFFLMQLDAFYVELKVSMKERYVETIIVFNDTSHLDAYLGGVDISSL